MKTKKGATLVGALVAITILSTTFIVLLNLQASIIRTKFFLQYDNTANLLATEGIEIVRAIYDIRNDSNFPNQASEVKYQVGYNTSTLNTNNTSTCTDTSINNSCDIDINSTGAYNISTASTGNRIFYRFITIKDSATTPIVTSTVIVRNPKGGNLRVYKVTAELYKIN